MSVPSIQSQINSLEKQIADLHKKVADETKREQEKYKQIDSVNRSITKNTSLSTMQSKQRQIISYNNDIVTSKKKIADCQRKISSAGIELGKKKQELRKAEDAEIKKSRREQMDFRRRAEFDLEEQRRQIQTLLGSASSSPLPEEMSPSIVKKRFDFFISHASEDKNELVRELATALQNKGCSVWYDEFELTIGDSLRKKIDEGLVNSRFGIVIISPFFVRKNWPEYELNGMVAREMNGHKVILPIWHKISKDEVLNFSPSLADKIALNTSIHTVDEIVVELMQLLKDHR